ncbi:hypothetical protein [Fontibacillus sp. BL9]|uniref:hypothetical protein n=1 Tax=Fontibacillus sp. BL9 TaxID=3389971 RepID=UPI00397E7108
MTLILEGETIYKYTDEEFMDKVNDKIGNVRLFKKHLRKQGLIGNRQQFSEEHIKLFKEIREYKRAHHTTWDMAFKVGLKSYLKEKTVQVPLGTYVAESLENNIEYTLTEILKTLQRIESKLNNKN